MGSDFKFYSLVDEERACGLGVGKESAFSSYNKFISDGFNGEYQCDGCQIVLLLLLLLFFVIVIIKCCLLWYYKLIFFFLSQSLPFSDALKLFSYLKNWVSNPDKVSLSCMWYFFNVHLHFFVVSDVFVLFFLH